MIGRYLLTPIDIVMAIFWTMISLVLIIYVDLKFRERLSLAFYQNSKQFIIQCVLAILMMNIPFFILQNSLQSAANSHLDPIVGYLISITLVCIILYLLTMFIVNLKLLFSKPLLLLVYLQFLFTSYFWIQQYFLIECTVCKLG